MKTIRLANALMLGLIFVALITLFFDRAFGADVPVDSPLPKQANIVGFIEERGCGHEFDLFIFMKDKRIVHYSEKNTPGDTALRELLAKVEGLTRTFTCGVKA